MVRVCDRDIVESGVTVFVSETSCDSLNVKLRVSEKLWESDTLTVCVSIIVGSMVNVAVAETSADMDSDSENVLDRPWVSVRVSVSDFVSSSVCVVVKEASLVIDFVEDIDIERDNVAVREESPVNESDRDMDSERT